MFTNKKMNIVNELKPIPSGSVISKVEVLFKTPKNHTMPIIAYEMSYIAKEIWNENNKFVNSDLQRRKLWFLEMKKAMEIFVQNYDTSTWFRKGALIVKQNQSYTLGKGGYGFVFQMFFNHDVYSRLPFVVKVQQYSGGSFGDSSDANFEIECGKKANEMLQTFNNPHFVFTYLTASFVSHDEETQQPINNVCIFQEYADGNMFQLVNSHIFDAATLFSFYLQIISAVLDMAVAFDMNHRDLYMRNILYNHVNPFSKKYVLESTTYTAHPTNILLKIADFGLCQQNDNQGLSFEKKSRWKNTFSGFCFHTAQIQLPKYAYDILTFTTDMLDHIKLRVDPSYLLLSNYFIRVLDYVDTNIKKNELFPDFLKTSSSLKSVVQIIFSENFMTKNLKHVVKFQVQ